MLVKTLPAIVATVAVVAAVAPRMQATTPTAPAAAEQSMKQFLAQGETLRPYRATRRLDARNGDRHGWLEATTELVGGSFRYTITAEGGHDTIRSKVLRPVLDAERDLIARGEMQRSALAPCNYEFQAKGIDADGLATVLLSPRRKERVLLNGTLFLRPVDGEPVRLEGRLAKSPSFWVKTVDIVRIYDRIGEAVMPVALESTAQVRFLGEATLRMTYTYSEIEGRPVAAGLQARR
jgi:hypothetical protein